MTILWWLGSSIGLPILREYLPLQDHAWYPISWSEYIRHGLIKAQIFYLMVVWTPGKDGAVRSSERDVRPSPILQYDSVGASGFVNGGDLCVGGGGGACSIGDVVAPDKRNLTAVVSKETQDDLT